MRPALTPSATRAGGAVKVMPEQPLANGFARQIERWSLTTGATARTARLAGRMAAAVSLATSAGHVCLALADALDRSDDPEAGAGAESNRHHDVCLADNLGPAADIVAQTAREPHSPDGGNAPESLIDLRQQLMGSGVVGTPLQPGFMPLVLDAQDNLYLHRYFDYECRLARRLQQATVPYTSHDAGAVPEERVPGHTVSGKPVASTRLLRERLTQLFSAGPQPTPGDEDGAQPVQGVDWQKLAAALALRGRLTIISGGPGTGKTTTVVNLLACLLEQDPDCRIALAAPTGKAAARMTEAIAQQVQRLPEPIRAVLPKESFTIHRLLGVRPAATGFRHHAGNPLAIDALVIDEASMLDLSLATRLLEAVPGAARIILLGDKDQLAAVESGAVFSELCLDASLSSACKAELSAWLGLPAALIEPPEPIRASGLYDSVVWLTRTYRFASDSGIARLAGLVKRGAAREVMAGLREGMGADVHWLDDGKPHLDITTLAVMQAGLAPLIEAIRTVPDDDHDLTEGIRRAHKAFASFRVLCAVRAGSRGVEALNRVLEAYVRDTLQGGSARAAPDSAPNHASFAASDSASIWYAGRPVLIQRNDYLLGLFNGDVGIAMPDASRELMVWFPQPDGEFRAVAPARLPPHETAFAMTVHKSQGSEFDQVLVLLPEQANRVLTRELLYTAITRARGGVTLVGPVEVLEAAVLAVTRRRSGLQRRLAEIARSGEPGQG